MKKNLVALAVLAASGVASAQSSVTLYGLADVWVGSSKTTVNGVGVRTTLLQSGGVSTSRFGFKGSEDLGGGLKANFQLEQGINIDTGRQQEQNVAFNRQAWVGLSGGFGEVQLGKVWTSYDDIRASANDTFNANIASSFSTWLGYSDRTNNGIKYLSPTFGGFSGSLTYALGEDKTPGKSASSVLSLGAQYAAGPLFVGFAHQRQEQNGANGVFSALPGVIVGTAFGTVLETAVNDAIVLAGGGKTTYNLINGSYDLGAVKLVGGYNQVKQTFVASGDSLKAKEYNIGAEAPLGASLNLGVGYSNSDIEQNGVDASDTKGFSAAMLYSLSKRTTAYAVVTQTKFNVTGSTDNLKSQLYAVGINHKF